MKLPKLYQFKALNLSASCVFDLWLPEEKVGEGGNLIRDPFFAARAQNLLYRYNLLKKVI